MSEGISQKMKQGTEVTVLSRCLLLKNQLQRMIDTHATGIDDADTTRLSVAISRMDRLHTRVRRPVHGLELVDGIRATHEVVDVSSDPRETEHLLETIYSVISKYDVPPTLYARIGEAFDEMHILPSEEIADGLAKYQPTGSYQ